MENNNSSGFMFPFITGLIAGAVVGILFAPDKGSETRKKVMNTIGDLTDNLSETLNGVVGQQGASSNSYEDSEESYLRGGKRSNQQHY